MHHGGSQPIRCGYCGQPLPHQAPEGLCPRCLLDLAAELGVQTPKAKAQSLEAAGEFRVTPFQDSQKAPDRPAGQRYGDYELLEKIGQGGMGVVYRAKQVNLGRHVAIKVLPFGQFSREKVVQRFRAEATAVGSLQHPNIVAIHHVGEHEGQPFFSMDLVEGRTLAELVRDAPLPARQAATWLKTIAEAVHYAHQHGVLHRDLKPSNILIDAMGQPRITDFGLAKRLDSTSDAGVFTSDLTLSGQVLGSPNFMAPEQAAGSRTLGPATDIYSLGALLYHMLTRQPPFQADSLTTLLKQVEETEPVAPRLLNSSIPPDLETICLKCLEKEAGRRYPTAQALADDLGRFLRGEPILARPVGVFGKAGKWCCRRPALASMSAGLLTVFVLGLAGVVWQWQRATRIARSELQQRQRAEASEYAADMRLAQLAIGENNRDSAVSLLDKHRPGAPRPDPQPSTDLRAWEWRYLWQLCQGDEESKLHHYENPVNALAVSRDFKLLAVTTWSESALWDLKTRKPLAKLPAGTRALAFSPVADVLAMGGWNDGGQPVVELWDVSSNKLTRNRTLPLGNQSLSFSPDGKLLAVFDHRGKVTIQEWAAGRVVTELSVLPLRDKRVALVVFSPDGSRVAIGEEYGRLSIVHLPSGAILSLQTETDAAISAIAFSPNSELLAAGIGSEQGTIRLWDIRTGDFRGQMTNHTANVTALVFTPDQENLLSSSLDGTIRTWRLADQRQVRCLQTSRDGVNALALLADGNTLISGGAGGSICFWDCFRTPPAVHTNLAMSVSMQAMSALKASDFDRATLHPNASRRFGVAFTRDSRRFITLNRDGGLALWDAHSFRHVEDLHLGSNHWGVALSPDERWLVTGDLPGQITVWDWTNRKAITNFPVDFEWFGLLRFSQSSQYLTAAISDNLNVFKLHIWRTGTWEEMPLTGGEFAGLSSVDLSPDDQLLAAGYSNGEVKLFRWPSQIYDCTFARGQGSLWSVCFSPDGRRVASAGFDGTVRVWDMVLRRQEVLRGHLGGGRRSGISARWPFDQRRLDGPRRHQTVGFSDAA